MGQCQAVVTPKLQGGSMSCCCNTKAARLQVCKHVFRAKRKARQILVSMPDPETHGYSVA